MFVKHSAVQSQSRESDMFLLLPLLGGILAGWLASRRTAIAMQVAFTVVAATVVTLSAPSHGASYRIVVWVVPVAVVVALVGLNMGFLIRRRRLAA
jgi:hypothetical protein